MMSYKAPTPEQLKELFSKTKRIAVVGLSDKPYRDSYRVTEYMLQQGYEIIPVNPHIDQVFGIRSVPTLADIVGSVDMVNVFRRSEYTPAIAKNAVEIGAKSLWLQQGVYSEEAYKIAVDAGLEVYMDVCLKVGHALYHK